MRGDFPTRPARLNGLRFGDEGRGESGAVTKDKAGEDDEAKDAESDCGGRTVDDPGEGGVSGNRADEMGTRGVRGDAACSELDSSGGVIV
jgi:hypothetical protein